MRSTAVLLFVGLALAAVIFLLTGGRVTFLPLLLIVPFGLFRLGCRN